MSINNIKSAVYSLKGIIQGIQADNQLNEKELQTILHWIEVHKDLRDIRMVNELFYVIDDILEDGIVTEEEHAEILDYLNHFEIKGGKIDQMTQEMLILQGFMQGIAADEEINKDELDALKDWMEHHRLNIEKWPYDALNNILHQTILNKRIDPKKKEDVMGFCKQFMHEASEHVSEIPENLPDFIQHSKNLKSISNVFDAVNIEIKGNTFCLSGTFEGIKKAELSKKIQAKGGYVLDRLTSDVHYLAVGSISSAGWKYGNYGTKVENVMKMKKCGKEIFIISEEQIKTVI